jgi:hypothetical protein
VISEDSDLLVYGVKRFGLVVSVLSLPGCCIRWTTTATGRRFSPHTLVCFVSSLCADLAGADLSATGVDFSGWSRDRFRHMCMLAGFASFLCSSCLIMQVRLSRLTAWSWY